MHPFDLANPHRPMGEQVVVVFGASSGIGRATALAAAARGARIVAAGRDEAALGSLVLEAAPAQVVTLVAEAADPVQVQAVAELAVSTFGRIDTWAHVAGIAQYARFEDMTVEEFRRVIEVDLLGPVWGARAALPHLRARGGALVVVSSEVAKRSFPLASSYSAAKHGVDGFLEALRVELQHEHVPVSVTQIMPAAVSTPFFEHARTRLGVRPSGPPPVYSPETVADAILDAAEHGGRDVAVGSAAKLQLALQRLSPRIMDAFARVAAFPLQRSKEPKGPGDDALFSAPHGDDRVRGVVTNLRR
jgi:NAD(P)-dependent dehydrogenase (short-subunit alcohol dehydrogenase family)